MPTVDQRLLVACEPTFHDAEDVVVVQKGLGFGGALAVELLLEPDHRVGDLRLDRLAALAPAVVDAFQPVRLRQALDLLLQLLVICHLASPARQHPKGFAADGLGQSAGGAATGACRRTRGLLLPTSEPPPSRRGENTGLRIPQQEGVPPWPPTMQQQRPVLEQEFERTGRQDGSPPCHRDQAVDQDQRVLGLRGCSARDPGQRNADQGRRQRWHRRVHRPPGLALRRDRDAPTWSAVGWPSQAARTRTPTTRATATETCARAAPAKRAARQRANSVLLPGVSLETGPPVSSRSRSPR